MIIDIIFFAIIAVLLAIKLKSILGQETDDTPGSFNEQYGECANRSGRKMRDITSCTVRSVKKDDELTDEEEEALQKNKYSEDIQLTNEECIDSSAMENFSIATQNTHELTPFAFIKTAREVFQMVIDSYSSIDAEDIKPVVVKDIYKNISDYVASQREIGIKSHVILVKILTSKIKNVKLNKSSIDIEILFESQQISYSTKVSDIQGEDSEEVSGDKDIIRNVSEIWTFSQKANASSPQWLLSDVVGVQNADNNDISKSKSANKS